MKKKVMLCVLCTLAAIMGPAPVSQVSAQATLPNFGASGGGERQRFAPERQPGRRNETYPTTSNSSVVTIKGGLACQKVVVKPGSSATLGTNPLLHGNIFAFTSITKSPGASSNGRAKAQNGAVTLDTNNVFICNLTPSAAMVNIGGRVTTADGRGISNALITITDPHGIARTAYTAPLGYYNFADVKVGQTLIFGISHKNYNFVQPVRVISLVGRNDPIRLQRVSNRPKQKSIGTLNTKNRQAAEKKN